MNAVVGTTPNAATFVMDTVLTAIAIATMPVPTVLTVGLICEREYGQVHVYGGRIKTATWPTHRILYIQLTTIRFPFSSYQIIEVLIHTLHYTATMREPSPTSPHANRSTAQDSAQEADHNHSQALEWSH